MESGWFLLNLRGVQQSNPSTKRVVWDFYEGNQFAVALEDSDGGCEHAKQLTVISWA